MLRFPERTFKNIIESIVLIFVFSISFYFVSKNFFAKDENIENISIELFPVAISELSLLNSYNSAMASQSALMPVLNNFSTVITPQYLMKSFQFEFENSRNLENAIQNFSTEFKKFKGTEIEKKSKLYSLSSSYVLEFTAREQHQIRVRTKDVKETLTILENVLDETSAKTIENLKSQMDMNIRISRNIAKHFPFLTKDLDQIDIRNIDINPVQYSLESVKIYHNNANTLLQILAILLGSIAGFCFVIMKASWFSKKE